MEYVLVSGVIAVNQ